ncbi:MAG TPA: MFS transporter [Streptosporangiaceae bacterium]|nr:MFS transporter [Streptosporangiaceae bacterium]
MSAGRRSPALAVTALCLVQFTDVLGVTVVVTALPSMLASLHASASGSTLVATGYAMFFGGLLMLGARLGDRFGHRRTILVSLAVLAAGGLVAATASSVVTLTAGRCLQGAAAAASVPSALRLLTTVTADGPARRRAIAAWSAAGAAAGASGFVIGGVVTDLASWRFVFWAYLPLAVILAAAIALSAPADAGHRPASSLNLAGSALFTATVMAFVVGSTVVTEPAGRIAGGLLFGACVVLLTVFVAADRRAADPLLPYPLISGRHLRQGALGAFLNTATTSSVLTLVTLFLQDTLHRTPLAAAATLLPLSLLVIVGSVASVRVQRRLSPQRVMAVGLLVIAAADAALIPAARSAWAVPLCAAAAGLGIGLSSVPATGLGTDVAERWRGGASGVVNTAAQLGSAVGITVLLLIASFSSGLPGPGRPPPGLAWGAAATAAAAGALRFAVTRSGRAVTTPPPPSRAGAGGPA